MSDIDGLIGRNTEAAVAKVLANYDGNDVLGFLADHPHHQIEQSPEPDDAHIVHRDAPHWLHKAHSYRGLEEIVGNKHNDKILRFWERCGLPFRDDETPWCAGFVGGVLEECQIKSTRSGLARSYLKWGVPTTCRVGAIVVFWRGKKNSYTGHVGFVASPAQGGYVSTLGGNQGNKVCVKKYLESRVIGYRWPY